MIAEKRIFALIALGLGIVAGALMLSESARGQSINVFGILAEMSVLYGSYSIFRGKTSMFLGWAKTRFGALLNLSIGLATLVLEGGIGGTSSILAIVSGILGFLAA